MIEDEEKFQLECKKMELPGGMCDGTQWRRAFQMSDDRAI